MRTVRDSLFAAQYQDRVLVEQLAEDGTVAETVTYGQVRAWSDHIRNALANRSTAPGAVVGLIAGNTPAWVAADLALLLGHFVEVPVPLAFSAEQAASLLGEAEICLADEAGARKLAEWGLAGAGTIVPIEGLAENGPAPRLPDEPAGDRIVKIIHTSGTTGVPKGVKIRRDALDILVGSLDSVTPEGTFDRYLSLVPLSLLIEQVAAIYLPMRAGGRVVLMPDSTPLLGTAGSRAGDVVSWLSTARPSATVLPPAAVSALSKAVSEGDLDGVLSGTRPFLMAGGAPVNDEELHRLDAAGLRVHEGYGLSENSSVVAWNTPDDWRPGTVGKPLPHCTVRLSAAGELLVKSPTLFAGYTVEDPTSRPVDADGWLHTGDRAEIDADGFVRILGRLKNVIITSHGRNVSPEWVEGRLRGCPGVLDAVVFGDGLEHLVAVLVTHPDAEPDEEELRRQAHAFAARQLSEVDRPERIIVVPDGKAFRARYFTVTGRPRREQIFKELVPS
ncbi:AMP-binding protein [Amycolatopsis pithecellobii]|uniref:AMP-binding protein n=1 Tax=Amycolatopsis pithecellobii TaxID=664692 RepID=A0A6N7Z0X4_9PSEU|nr:AMP-binding protein [Amycolatopsis pithecellobii]MTD57958.1 AMP-binding protein [Amycolatopsis pithecellobii]